MDINGFDTHVIFIQKEKNTTGRQLSPGCPPSPSPSPSPSPLRVENEPPLCVSCCWNYFRGDMMMIIRRGKKWMGVCRCGNAACEIWREFRLGLGCSHVTGFDQPVGWGMEGEGVCYRLVTQWGTETSKSRGPLRHGRTQKTHTMQMNNIGVSVIHHPLHVFLRGERDTCFIFHQLVSIRIELFLSGNLFIKFSPISKPR